VNRQDWRGWTAVAHGAANGFTHIVRVLVNAGADLSLTTLDGQTPADVAFASGFYQLAEILESCDGKEDNRLNGLPDTLISKTKPAESKFVSYGDLELFLHGLELGDVISKFQEHKISFAELLKLTDSDLVTIGINELGVRKKLLTAIHNVNTEEWDLSSLSTATLTKMSTLELASMFANLTNHLKCMESTVLYLHRQMKIKKDEVLADNPSLQKMLVDQSSETLSACTGFNESVRALSEDVNEIFVDQDLQPVSLITPKRTRARFSNNFYIWTTVAVVCTGIIIGNRLYPRN